MNKLVRKNRLLKLADFLENVPRKTFDLEHWLQQKGLAPKCNTTACAVGWACSIPSFRKAGFRIDIDNRGGGKPVFKNTYKKTPKYTGWAAVDKFFDVERGDSESLFSCRQYLIYGTNRKTTPKQVASRIRKFVKGLS